MRPPESSARRAVSSRRSLGSLLTWIDRAPNWARIAGSTALAERDDDAAGRLCVEAVVRAAPGCRSGGRSGGRREQATPHAGVERVRVAVRDDDRSQRACRRYDHRLAVTERLDGGLEAEPSEPPAEPVEGGADGRRRVQPRHPAKLEPERVADAIE